MTTMSRAKRRALAERRVQKLLEVKNTEHGKEIERLSDQISRQEELLRYTEERNKDLLTRHQNHIAVLAGDRDVLTRALEVCSRRLSSPAADQDPTRAGWRTNSPMAMGVGEKAIDPEFLRGKRR